MSTKSVKRLRRRLRLRAVSEDLDRRKRRAMRVPWWVIALSWLVEPHLRAWWVANWEAEHQQKLRRAYRATVKYGRRMGG